MTSKQRLTFYRPPAVVVVAAGSPVMNPLPQEGPINKIGKEKKKNRQYKEIFVLLTDIWACRRRFNKAKQPVGY